MGGINGEKKRWKEKSPCFEGEGGQNKAGA
jgi:hypothetical protein